MDTNRQEDREAQAETKTLNHPSFPRKSSAASGDSNPSNEKKSFAQPPALSLPKGGGAIRDMGEKFEVNAANGTGSFVVPIALSPGRSGFGPQLSLSYNSGSGNGPFGLGWGLSIGGITRKTEKGLPRYNDGADSDIFILPGSEDLVPVCAWNGTSWAKNPQPGTWNGANYSVQRYRPRIEGLFARIEKWTGGNGDVFWKAVTKDNVASIYGKDPFGTDSNTRIFDPADPTRIYKWLLAETYDDKGNWIVYQYVPEDSTGVDATLANEANRTTESRGAQRYLKNVYYGNRESHLSQTDPAQAQWMFQAVFDYGEGQYAENPPDSDNNIYAQASAILPVSSHWPVRLDPFSNFRPCFEVRTYRLCQRVLMFHLFNELAVNPCLVKSTEFTYDPNPNLTMMTSAAQNGFIWQASAKAYLKKSAPALLLTYIQPTIDPNLHFVDGEDLENIPEGLERKNYEWVDLNSEGLSGILNRQPDGWYYKPNISALPVAAPDGTTSVGAHFAPMGLVLSQPGISGKETQLMDLNGDGRKSLVQFHKPVPGYLERTPEGQWEPFLPFPSTPNIDWNDPNLKFVDLNGDGFADILVSEDEVFHWYPSYAKAGFGQALTVPKPWDEEQGPALVFADRTEMIFLADMTGDGLTDIVRIRWGEACYWPNKGFGQFGTKVSMDNAPVLESHETFDPKRVRLADIDGSGTSDLIYLGNNSITFWFNQAGNSFGAAQTIPQFPDADSLSNVAAVDLMGIGTACLVWSSSLPGDAGRPFRYIDLMSGQKPYLLIGIDNQMGKQTLVTYAPSTRFYLQDKYAGTPWLTRLPFPVQTVERVDTYDLINHSRFVTCYAYHHGFYDGVEREFRGFGMVEQWDTEEFASLEAGGTLPGGVNFNAASNIPPVHTKTWFHTGAYFGEQRLMEGFEEEYFSGDPQAWATPPIQMPLGTILVDGTSPAALQGTTAHEDREAYRALKGGVLRQEIYADDGSAQSQNPYSVVAHAYTVQMLQPVLGTGHPGLEPPHGVFYTYPSETVSYHYERNPADPRIGHEMTLAVNGYGDATNSVSIGYGRRGSQADPSLSTQDQTSQSKVWVTYTEHDYTNNLDDASAYRTPLPREVLEYELTGFQPAGGSYPFLPSDFAANGFKPVTSAATIPFEQTANFTQPQKRLIADTRTLYRSDDLTTPLAPGVLESLAIPYQDYQMAYTYGLASQVYANPALASQITDALGALISTATGYVPDPNTLDGSAPASHAYTAADGGLWVPSGKVFLSANSSDTPAQELAYAQQHFFLPLRFQDPFGNVTTISYDPYDLLIQQTRDALGNLTTSGSRDTSGNLTANGNDYRVLQPVLMMDPNRNQAAFAFDTLGFIAGTAVMGKPEDSPAQGDSLAGFTPDLTDAVIAAHLADPLANPGEILQQATTRTVYDLFAFQRTQGESQPLANVVYALSRETHVSDLAEGQTTLFQHEFSYSDGFGRILQKKIQAEPGPLDLSTPSSPTVDPRWVGNGWTVFNNKGQPVRKYEPFFSATQQFEFAVAVGVSPVLFYDPLGRIACTLHPDQSYEKAVFDPWSEARWDSNDTVLLDPSTDPDVAGFFSRIPAADYSPTWYAQRQAGGSMSAQDQAAATNTVPHANTPALTYLDSLGRIFLSLVDNGPDAHGNPQKYPTHTQLDVQENKLSVTDALGRQVMTYLYGMLKNKVQQSSMEAGVRWVLADVAMKPVLKWNSRLYRFRQVYDGLHRPFQFWASLNGGTESLIQYTVYGESNPNAQGSNLLGQVNLAFDQAGMASNLSYDFKGNLLGSSRQFAAAYQGASGTTFQVDWSGLAGVAYTQITSTAAPLLAKKTPSDSSPETFVSGTTYDALNRPVTLTSPDSSVILPVFNESNLLTSITVRLQGGTTTPYITGINYDAKGQRTVFQYASGAATTYAYDALTFRLTELKTTRPTPGSTTGATDTLQDLNYFYDSVGNVSEIDDNAQETLYFQNTAVTPNNLYTYDPLYRLLQAQGREHAGQNLSFTAYDNWDDASDINLPQPGDGTQMTSYAEQYQYDAVGNFLGMSHQATGNNWTRNYNYAEPSLLETGKVSNRLSNTQAGGFTYPYAYDAHGNLLNMPHLSLMQWDCLDELQAASQQAAAGGNVAGTTYYAYDMAGKRARKATGSQAAAGQTPVLTAQRMYIGNYEVYREYGPDGTTINLERQSLGVMDGMHRIALVETQVTAEGAAVAQPVPLPRFQLDNHLDSALLELDDQARIISYEEYFPYGATSYQAVDSSREVPEKRYRHTGKERDSETGFNYHGARYYTPWLGRWISCDPAGIQSSINLYRAFRDCPLGFTDPSGNQDFKSAGKGMQSVQEVALNVDELQAVGERGISAAESMRRATDMGNRQFLEHFTNQATKGERVFVPITPPNTNLPPTTVAQNPSALLTRPRLGGIKEWDDLTVFIQGKVANRLAGKTAGQVKEIINDAIREEIKHPTTAPGRAISDAMSRQLNIPAEELFSPKFRVVQTWDGAVQQFGAPAARTLPTATADSAANAAAKPSIWVNAAKGGVLVLINIVTTTVSVSIVEGNKAQQEQNVLDAANHVSNEAETKKRQGMEADVLSSFPVPFLNIPVALTARFITDRLFDMGKADAQKRAQQILDQDPNANVDQVLQRFDDMENGNF